MRWHEQYRVGEVVEAVLQYAEGPTWVKSLVLRKTQTGLPIVRALNSKTPGCTCVAAGRDIRKVAP